ncbi:hypothetical protein GCM10023142_34980 [Anaerocolumna aminovalerica]
MLIIVNGRALVEEVKSIEKFFQEMSIEEFDKMMLECGADYINEIKESNYDCL